jgi:hypothetical protein
MEAILSLGRFTRDHGVLPFVKDADMFGSSAYPDLCNPAGTALNDADTARPVIFPYRTILLVCAVSCRTEIPPRIVQRIAVDVVDFGDIIARHHLPDNAVSIDTLPEQEAAAMPMIDMRQRLLPRKSDIPPAAIVLCLEHCRRSFLPEQLAGFRIVTEQIPQFILRRKRNGPQWGHEVPPTWLSLSDSHMGCFT